MPCNYLYNTCYLGQIYPVELDIKDTTETNTYVLYLDFQHDFHLHVSSSDKDMSGNVWNRPSGSFMVDMGISSNIMKFPSPKCYMTFCDMVIYRDTLNWSDIIQGSHFEPATGDFPPATSSKIAGYFLKKNWELLGNIMDLH